MNSNRQLSYEHYIQTGSGNVAAKLTLSDSDLAEINFDLRWMGVGYKGFRIQCLHEAFSDYYGLLRVTSIEKLHEPTIIDVEELDELVRHPEFPEFYSDPDLDEDIKAVLREITFEYVRLPRSEPYIPDDPGYRDMKRFGLADWNEKFDLMLMLHFCAAFRSAYEAEFNDEDLEGLLENLDKMKFAAI